MMSFSRQYRSPGTRRGQTRPSRGTPCRDVSPGGLAHDSSLCNGHTQLRGSLLEFHRVAARGLCNVNEFLRDLDVAIVVDPDLPDDDSTGGRRPPGVCQSAPPSRVRPARARSSAATSIRGDSLTAQFLHGIQHIIQHGPRQTGVDPDPEDPIHGEVGVFQGSNHAMGYSA